MLITIDGPSGSGKTTLATLIAKNLHFFCFSSGYVYRALSYILKNFYNYGSLNFQNPDLKDITAILQNHNFRYEYQYGIAKVYWTDDITSFLKDMEISNFAAILAKNQGLRLMVRVYEKNIVSQKDAVVEGRACGSIVYPHADLKFYLEASIVVRTQRLQNDQMKRGNSITYQQAWDQVKMRDEMDTNREIEPLQIPKDAIILDSEKNSTEELLEKVLYKVKEHLDKKSNSI